MERVARGAKCIYRSSNVQLWAAFVLVPNQLCTRFRIHRGTQTTLLKANPPTGLGTKIFLQIASVAAICRTIWWLCCCYLFRFYQIAETWRNGMNNGEKMSDLKVHFAETVVGHKSPDFLRAGKSLTVNLWRVRFSVAALPSLPECREGPSVTFMLGQTRSSCLTCALVF